MVARYHQSMNELTPRKPDKFKAYRARKKAAGLREVRMWVPDVRTKEFWEKSVRESVILRDHPSEEETMRWIETLHADDPGMWD
jgi:Protein  of unknown function (DUF3018)